MSIEDHISNISAKISRLTRQLNLLKEKQVKNRFDDTLPLETIFSLFEHVKLRQGSGMCGESNMCYYPAGKMIRITFEPQFKDPSFKYFSMVRSIAIKYGHTIVGVKKNEICYVGYKKITDTEKQILSSYGLVTCET